MTTKPPPQSKIKLLFSQYKNREYQEAKNLAYSITKKYPDYYIAWKILGAVLGEMNLNIEAVAACKRAIHLKPKDVAPHYNLAISLKRLKRFSEAEKSFRDVTILLPYSSEAHYNLGNALRDTGKFEDSILSYKKAISYRPDFSRAYNNCGNILELLGKFDEAKFFYEKAIKFNANFSEARYNLNKVVEINVPAWHVAMVNDESRNQTYYKAIKRAINKNDLVLDIGSGSGLLSMMSAASGAADVISCEMSTTLAKAAKKIVRDNGYAEKIKVINKSSSDLVIGDDLPQKADVIISEILSSTLVGEGIRASLLDANKRLLKENGKMIPESGEIIIGLMESNAEIESKAWVKNFQEFDLSNLNSVTQSEFSLNLSESLNMLSNPQSAFKINFYEKKEMKIYEKIINITANKSGLCIGLIQWLKIQLYQDIIYENYPGKSNSHWPNSIYLFDEPIEIQTGDSIQIKAFLGNDSTWFHKLA